MPSGHVFSRHWLNEKFANATSRKNLRPDVQGLRMLAVVAVILDHLIHWPSGGFVGVDVFFVISGFLITGILLREHEKTGHISFVGFYRRRVKRILPAATIVLVVTVFASYFIFNRARYWQTLVDSIWAFFFSANWRFASAGTDYFQASGPVSPLQHFWSLSVEEQFYFVWPWVMLGVLAIAGLRGTAVRRRTITGIVMAIIVVSTFAYALYDSAANPTVAYFSTFTRAWELGLGALIAIASPWWSHIRRNVRPVLGWIGLLGILASYFVINDTMPFPAPWGLLPVLATGLVIIAGTGGEQRFLFPLDNPISFYIGNISYSLYLWHFPIIIFIGVLVPDPVAVITLALTLTFFLSVVTYHLVEIPVQRSPILERHAPGRSKSSRKRARRYAWKEWRTEFAQTYRIGVVSLAVVVGVGVVYGAWQFEQPRAVAEGITVETPDAAASPTPGASSTMGPAVSALQAEIATSLSATSWPALNPSLESVIGGSQAPAEISACGKPLALPVSDCRWGDAPRTALLVGDSTSLAYAEAFRALSATAGWTVETRAMFGCPFVDISIANNDAAVVAACGQRNAETIARIVEIHPDLVIATATYEQRNHALSGEPVTSAEWSEGLRRYMEQVAPNAGRVVLLSPPPSSVNVQDCYTPQSAPIDCVSDVTERYAQMVRTEQVAAESTGALYVDARRLFCSAGYCPAFVGSTPTKLDLVHITVPYAQKIAPGLLELLREAGVS